jgi:hypothetical protein
MIISSMKLHVVVYHLTRQKILEPLSLATNA